MVNYR
ncbi:hypothetical protein [Plasmodium yoelii yoelii]